MPSTNDAPSTIATSPAEREMRKEIQLNAAIEQGIDDLAEGRVSSAEDLVEHLRNRIAK